MSQPSWWLGIDLGSQQHELCLLDATGTVVRRGQIRHDPAGVARLVAFVDEATGRRPTAVAAALETPRCLVGEVLQERGVQLYAINPKQLDRFRDRHTVAGAKDDRLDAYVLADSLRTDTHLFRRVAPLPPENYRLRELTRTLAELEQLHRQQANRLWSVLNRYFPILLRWCPGADEPWLWALLRQAATPAQAAALSTADLQQILRRHRIRRLTAVDLQAALAEPGESGDPLTVELGAQRVHVYLDQLELIQRQIRQCSRAIQAIMNAPSADPAPTDREIVRSVVGIGWKTGAILLGEAATAIQQADYRTLRGECGVAPVTKGSGLHRVTLMRRACDHRLRLALHHAAGVAIQHVSPWYRIYHRIRLRGGSHARALRQVGDRLLKVLTTMLHNRTLFDLGRLNGVTSTLG